MTPSSAMSSGASSPPGLPPPVPLGGRDAGGQLRDWNQALSPAPDDVRRAFGNILRRTLSPLPDTPLRRKRTTVSVAAGMGVLPNASDRLAPARRALGAPGTLWQQRATVPVRLPEVPPSAHVYLDVSGSMFELIPFLTSLLLPYVADGRARVFQFSTRLEPLSLEDLRRGELKTTGGTDIRPVFDHLLADGRVRRALILTDGYTGQPTAEQAAQIDERRVRLHVVLPQESAWRRDLEPVAASLTVLPPLRPVGQPWRSRSMTTTLPHLAAEDVLAGHPDRLCDAIAEAIVDAAVAHDPEALVGVEVGLHRQMAFVTGRIAAGEPSNPLGPRPGRHRERCLRPRRLHRRVGAAAAGRSRPRPRAALGRRAPHPPLLRRSGHRRRVRLRRRGDGLPAAAGLPGAPPAPGALGAAPAAPRPPRPGRQSPCAATARCARPRVAAHQPGAAARRGLGYRELHQLVLRALEPVLVECGALVPHPGRDWETEILRLNGAGDFSCGGPKGDNGLSGKKLVVDHYGPGVPIGGGALCGKDPHKVDRIGALCARQLALRLLHATGAEEVTTYLGYLPGLEAPDMLAARVGDEWWDADRIAQAIPIPDLTIQGAFDRLELAGVRWAEALRAGYFGGTSAWER